MKKRRIRWTVAGVAAIAASLGLVTVALASPSTGTVTGVVIDWTTWVAPGIWRSPLNTVSLVQGVVGGSAGLSQPDS